MGPFELILTLIAVISKPVEKIVFRWLGLRIEVGLGTKSVDDRLAKLDAAKSNLEEALQAIGELRSTVEDSKSQVAAAESKLKQLQDKKNITEQELAELKKLFEIDAGSFQKYAGVPSKRQAQVQLLIAFFLGILASLAASFVWHLVTSFFGIK